MQLSDIKSFTKREYILSAGMVVLLVLVGYLLVENQNLRSQNTELQTTVETQNKKIENLEKLVKIFNKDFSDLKGAADDAKATLGRTLEKMGQVLKGE
jgi:cell division protein FtsL